MAKGSQGPPRKTRAVVENKNNSLCPCSALCSFLRDYYKRGGRALPLENLLVLVDLSLAQRLQVGNFWHEETKFLFCTHDSFLILFSNAMKMC